MQKTAYWSCWDSPCRLPTKMLRIMKITSLLLLAICLHVSASTFSQSITFSGRNVPMKKIFATIKQQTGYVVWGKSELLQNAGPVSASVQNMPLTSFLDLIMKDQLFTYKIADNTILLQGKQLRAADGNLMPVQDSPVKGRVTDSTGIPLIGATVAVVGSSRPAVTDMEGVFTLSVTAGSRLRISFIGYRTKEITVTAAMLQSGNVGNIILSVISETLTGLEVTANTGYQKIPLERATGSFGVVTEETINARMEMSLLARLEGTVPGLFMQNGAVYIRGLSTLYATQSPLIVVDGFPFEGDLGYINPADVVNVTVMKDAAASSIYGTRAANGVISITTRHGSSRKLTIHYSSSAFVSGKPDAGYMNLLNSREMVDLEQEMFNIWHPTYNDAIRRAGQPKAREALYNHEQGLITKAQLDETLERLRNSNGQGQLEDLYMRNKLSHRHSLSVSGGNDVHQYNVMMNYTGSNDYGFRTNSDEVNIGIKDKVKVFNWLDAEAGVQTNISDVDRIREGPLGFYRNMPYEILRNPDGSSAPFTKLKSDYEIQRLIALGLHDETFKPLDEMNKSELKYNSNYFRLQGGFTVKIIPGLTMDLKYQTERGSSHDKNYYSSDSYYAKNMINDAAQVINGELVKNVPDGGQMYEVRTNSKSYTARGQLNFDRRFGSKHQLTALAGMEQRAIAVSRTSVFKMGYNDNNLTFLPVNEIALGNLKGTESLTSTYARSFNDGNNFGYEEDRYVSTYANAGYTYDGKYNLTGSARMDNSNLFGTDRRYRYLPLWSVGASWRLTEEDFMKDISWLNSLSIRTTYGLGGIVARRVGPYLQARSYFLAEANATATDIIYPPNKSLRWEQTATTNIGIDFAVLKSRISGSVDYYFRKTSDLMGERTIDPTNAFPRALINYGKLNNRGIELQLTSRNIEQKNFSWNTTLTFGHNKNEMTDINTLDESYYGLTQGYGVNRIGYPMDAVFSFRSAGLDPTNGSVLVYDAEGKVVKNYDATGAIVANMTDIKGLVYNGTLRPKWTSGLTNRFTYKDITLSVMLIGSGGHVIRDVVPPHTSGNLYRNQDKRVMNFWRKPGDEKVPGMLPAPDLKGNGGTYYTLIWFAADQNVLKADYIKVRDITLSYNFAPVLTSIKKLSSARLSLQVQNPFRWVRNDVGIDPEAYEIAGTYANRGLPVTPVYSVGLDITF